MPGQFQTAARFLPRLRLLRWPALLVVCLVAGSSRPSFAQVPTARLYTVFPPGGKAGATFEVAVAGTDLDEAGQLHFSQPGITGKPRLNEKTGAPEAGQFVVTIPAGTPPGVCEARVAGRFGISNPRAFAIGDLPENTAPATNTTAASAAQISAGSVVNGRVAANAVAWFKFTARKGQRVLFDCAAREIDSRLEEVLTLQDASGREWARNRRGGLLDFTAPADGTYLLKLHDATFRGGDEYFFRLTASMGPWIDFIFPPAGEPGTRGRFTLYGRNLPGGQPSSERGDDGHPLEQLGVEIEIPGDAAAKEQLNTSTLIRPADSVLDGFEYRLKAAPGVSNPVLISHAHGPVVVSAPTNRAPERAQRVELPGEIAGRFYPAGETHWFTFEARKDSVIWFEVVSQRLGLPTDPYLLVQRVTKNDKGELQATDALELYDTDANLGGPEFNTTTRDPTGSLRIPEDGTYRVGVRDLFSRSQGSPRNVYRLSIRKPLADFRLVALPVVPPQANKDLKLASAWTPFLRRGETLPVRVLVFRRDNFNQEIQLGVTGLPPGVSASAAKIDADKKEAFVLLTAAEDAPAWAGAIQIAGHAGPENEKHTRGARGAGVVWNVGDYNNEPVFARMTRDLVLGVSGLEAAAITVEPVEKKTFEAAAGGKLQIPLRVTRRAEFNDNLKLKAMGLAALASLPEPEVTAKTNAFTLEIDLGKFPIPAGTHQFYLQAETKGKYRPYAAETKAADEAVKAAEKESAEAAAETKKANDGLAAATKTATDVTAQLKSVTDKDKEVVEAKIKTATEARIGAEKIAGEAAAKARAAEEKKIAAQNRAKEMAEKSKPRDANIMVYSTPINVKVAAVEKK